MKKKYLLFISLFLLYLPLFSQETIESIEKKQSPKLDMDFKVYLPSTFGIVSGNNPLLGSREESSDISCINLLIESRFSIATVKKVTFAWSFASGGYVETKQNSSDNAMSFNISLGGGIYLHPFNLPTYQLNGACVFLYPLYQIPIFFQHCEPYIKWKSAIDFGYNLTLASVISVYPYVRSIFYWTEKDTRFALDFGFSIGIYLHHNSQQILDETKNGNIDFISI